MVVEEAKSAIKPHYEQREITKVQYKDIMKKAVNKVCQTDKNMEINAVKIRRLIRRYVEVYRQKNEKNKEKMRSCLDQPISKSHKKQKKSRKTSSSKRDSSAASSAKNNNQMTSLDDDDDVDNILEADLMSPRGGSDNEQHDNNDDDKNSIFPSMLKSERRKIVTLPDLPLPPPPPPPRPSRPK